MEDSKYKKYLWDNLEYLENYISKTDDHDKELREEFIKIGRQKLESLTLDLKRN